MAKNSLNKELMSIAGILWMRAYTDQPAMDTIKFALRCVCNAYKHIPGNMGAESINEYINAQFNPPDQPDQPVIVTDDHKVKTAESVDQRQFENAVIGN
jgi:hypothetical protein